MNSLARVVLLFALPSCLFETAEPDPALATSSQAVSVFCEEFSCGNGNSPVVDGLRFSSLHATPGPTHANAQGVYIESVETKFGIPLQLSTPGAGLKLMGTKPGGVTLVGTDLEGVKIYLRTGTRRFLVTIEDVTGTHELEEFWFRPEKVAEYYTFKYVAADALGPTKPTPLCQSEVLATGEHSVRALVFGRDVYDQETKTISIDTSTTGRFNIACEFGAPWKMQMTGYTKSTQAYFGHATSDDDNQALLKAWTGDVCGTGKAFTVQGEKITLKEAHLLLPPTSPYRATKTLTMEAVWGPQGALCLEVPRLRDKDKRILDKIAEECDLPPKCGSSPPAGTVVTGNPPPPLVFIAP